MVKQSWNIDSVKEFVNINSEATLLATEYVNSKSKMQFLCKCGNPFDTTFEKFNLRNKRQCGECGRKIMMKKQKLPFGEVKSFIESTGCVLISTEYTNRKEKLEILCTCGEPFNKSFEKFKKSPCCKKCSYNQISEDQTFTYEFVKSFIEENSNCKLISEEYNSIYENLIFVCECGEDFPTTFSSFRHSNQRSCKKCSNAQSKGEQLIELYLKENNLQYETQYKFEDLIAKNGKQRLRFDFAVFKNEKFSLIEFDGKQHFGEVEYFGGKEAFETLKYNDNSKNEYCKTNDIELIRIPYYEIDNIEKILSDKLI